MSQAVNHRISAQKGPVMATSFSSYGYNFLVVVLELLEHFKAEKELPSACDNLYHIDRNKAKTRPDTMELLPVVH